MSDLALHRAFAAAALLTGTVLVHAQEPTTAFMHVELHNGRGVVTKDATIVVRGAEIVGIRQGTSRATGERVVDLSGRVVIPGIIDANASLLAGQGFNYEREQPILPNLRVQDAIEARDRIHAGPAALETGLTIAYLSPGAWRPIGGQGLTVRLDGETLLDMAMPGRAFVHFSINEGALFTFGRGEAMPQTHMGIVGLIRRKLIEARAYALARASEAGTSPARFDPDLETLGEVLAGKRTVRIDADSAHEIESAVALADEFHIRPVLEHCVEAYKVRDLLARKRFPLVLMPFTQGDVFDLEEERSMLETPGWLASHGVPVAFQTFGHGMPPYGNLHEYNEPHSLLLDAVLQIRAGMDREAVLTAITSAPAEILGIADRVGSLEAGRLANFVVLDGQPFEYATQVLQVWMSGRPVFDARTHSVMFK